MNKNLICTLRGLLLLLFVGGGFSCHSLRSTSFGAQGTDGAQAIYAVMKKVADWQIDSIAHQGWRHDSRDWTNGALYTGLLAMADVSGDSSYLHFLRRVGEKADWQIVKGPDRYFADNYCVGQMYCGLYARYKDPVMIADLAQLADTLIARPHTESLKWGNHIQLREWAWCDGLFMGPPSLAMLAHVTGDRKYLDLVDRLWWKTTDYLYDPAEHLYYRDSRYFDQREKNGKKVFWSRGNGWVMGGLVRVLEQMPHNYPDRSRLIQLYRDMAATIAALQQPDGTWHASLLDPESYPIKETSGTGFFCYALAWGINHQLLEAKQYEPVVRKAWNALVNCVHPNGMLGYAQAIGAAPGSATAEDTEVYAVGAFLLAGRQLLALSGGKKVH